MHEELASQNRMIGAALMSLVRLALALARPRTLPLTLGALEEQIDHVSSSMGVLKSKMKQMASSKDRRKDPNPNPDPDPDPDPNPDPNPNPNPDPNPNRGGDRAVVLLHDHVHVRSGAVVVVAEAVDDETDATRAVRLIPG